jgi:hypothetical protein
MRRQRTVRIVAMLLLVAALAGDAVLAQARGQ